MKINPNLTAFLVGLAVNIVSALTLKFVDSIRSDMFHFLLPYIVGTILMLIYWGLSYLYLRLTKRIAALENRLTNDIERRLNQNQDYADPTVPRERKTDNVYYRIETNRRTTEYELEKIKFQQTQLIDHAKKEGKEIHYPTHLQRPKDLIQ